MKRKDLSGLANYCNCHHCVECEFYKECNKIWDEIVVRGLNDEVSNSPCYWNDKDIDFILDKIYNEDSQIIENSSEYVGVGHIDRVCDLIAQKILTEALLQDENSRVAIEVSCSKNILLIFGEITTEATLNYPKLARDVLNDCLLTEDYYNPTIIVDVNKQSENISERVNQKELCWGDQSTTIGHHCNSKSSGLPESYVIARNIVTIVESLPKENMEIWWNLTKDIKCLVEMYEENISKVTLSIQTHVEEENYEIYYNLLMDRIFNLYENKINLARFDFILDLYPRTSSLCDSGTTNRKIGVDMYGTSGLMDGGGFNGKDYTKGDMAGKILAEEIASKIAKEFDFGGTLKKVDVIINFNMGLSKPSSIIVKVDGEILYHAMKKSGEMLYLSMGEIEELMGFELTLQNVVDRYNLKEIDYYYLAYNNLSYHYILKDIKNR